MTKLNPILLKPQSGWSRFNIGDFSFPVSYVVDTPQDIIDALIGVIKNRSFETILIDGEGEECLVTFCPYSGVYTIVNRSSNPEIDDKIETRYFNINIIRIAEQFIKDIERYAEDWAIWLPGGDEEYKQYYDLTELKELIKNK